tara:strand:- start:638 stop:1024 length:387 start_codon:yes stop_codon:yes gene_type:complete
LITRGDKHVIISIENIVDALKVISGVAIFFVWVVRYENIKREFEEYQLPTWLRDLTGILKISFACMLQFSDPEIVRLGALGISLLMAAAVVTHIRLKSTFRRYIASVTMLLMSITILYYSNNEIIGAS